MTDRISPALLKDAIVVTDGAKRTGDALAPTSGNTALTALMMPPAPIMAKSVSSVVNDRVSSAVVGPEQRTVTDKEAVQMAMALQKDGKFARAEEIYRQILAQQPRQSDALHLLGLMMYQRGRLDLAVDLVRRAIDARPNFSTYYSNLGVILRAKGDQSAALQAYSAGLRLAANNAELHNNLSVIHDDMGNAELALRHGWMAIALDPHYPEARNNLANTLRRQGRLYESVAQLQAALKTKSHYPDAWFNLGLALEELGDHKQALRCYDNAVRLDDKHVSAQANRALLSLKLADFGTGLDGFELRLRAASAAPNSPLWQGQPIAGKTLLLLGEPGLGDAIMFSRYCLLAAKASGAHLIGECDRSLRELFAGIGSVAQWVDRRSPLPAHDFHLPLLGLPRVLKTTAQTIPAPYAYLRAPANRVQRPDLRIGADLPIGRKVGIVWSGNPERDNNAKRSCPFSFFVQLLQVPDLQLIGLQKGTAAADWQGVNAPARMRDMAARCDDFGDTAMVIAQLDLVIAVDTAVAHLAGAMGKPVWLLLPKVAEWRWQLDRDDSPWYPSMRLFRQEQAGDWGGVFQRLINQLKLDGGTPSATASSHGPA